MIITSAVAVESIDDLLIEIMLKLPLRSLARFKLVSKRWHSIILDRVFLLLGNNPNPAVGLFHPNGSYTYKYIRLDMNAHEDPPFTEKLPFQNHRAWPIWIHQSCNGLLLCCSSGNSLLNYPIRRCYVYNPTTKYLTQLPRPGVCQGGVPRSVVSVNLAFDPCLSPLYKAVCVRGSELGPNLLQVEVYSVESNAWRSSGKPFSRFNILHIFRHGVYWNSSIHWINYRALEILYFNVDDELLRKIPLPAAMNDLTHVQTRRASSYFGESCGHLHMIPMARRSTLDVYEMKRDYSEWFVKYKVYTTNVYPEIGFRAILTLTRGHEVSFLFMRMSNSVVRYNLVSGTYSTTNFRFENDNEFQLKSYDLQGFQYIESLARVS